MSWRNRIFGDHVPDFVLSPCCGAKIFRADSTCSKRGKVAEEEEQPEAIAERKRIVAKLRKTMADEDDPMRACDAIADALDELEREEGGRG